MVEEKQKRVANVIAIFELSSAVISRWIMNKLFISFYLSVSDFEHIMYTPEISPFCWLKPCGVDSIDDDASEDEHTNMALRGKIQTSTSTIMYAGDAKQWHASVSVLAYKSCCDGQSRYFCLRFHSLSCGFTVLSGIVHAPPPLNLKLVVTNTQH